MSKLGLSHGAERFLETPEQIFKGSARLPTMRGVVFQPTSSKGAPEATTTAHPFRMMGATDALEA
jgi:hypothetical protein